MIDSLNISLSKLSEYSDISQVIIGLITLIIGYLTFRLARKVQKEFIRNHTKSKQVEQMSKLVEFLNNTKIYLTFADFYDHGGAGGTSHGIKYNIFEIGNLLNDYPKNTQNKKEIDFNNYDECPVFLDKNTDQIMEIKEFIDNPFIPKKIADGLFDFYITFTNNIKSDILEKNKISIVILNTVNTLQGFDYFKETYCEVLKTWLNFKTYARNLTVNIKNWFYDNGISDFNIRIDYKN